MAADEVGSVGEGRREQGGVARRSTVGQGQSHLFPVRASVSQGVGVYCNFPDVNVCEWSVAFLRHWLLLEFVQNVHSIDHPVERSK